MKIGKIDKQIRKLIGVRIKQVRKSKNLTQQEFAGTLGITQGFYAGIERGKHSISIESLNYLSIKFNINLNWLFSGEGEMYYQPDHENEIELIFNKYPEFRKSIKMMGELKENKIEFVERFIKDLVNLGKK